MKICLINPCPDFVIDTKVFPPLGLLYVAAAVEKAGHEVRVHDTCLIGDKVPDGYDVYGVTANVTQLGWIKQWFKKHRGRNPDSLYVVGGPYVGTTEDSLGFDLAFAGEAEEEFPKWLDSLSYYQSGEIVQCLPVSLKSGIYPARHLIDIHQYRYLIDGRPATPMMTIRGCPFSCSFCSKRPQDSEVRFRDIDDILKELEEIIEMGFEAVRFYDDTFNLNVERCAKLCQAIEPYGLFWKAEVRADRVNYKLVEAMALAGCKEVAIGVESGSQKILDNVKKGTSAGQNHTVTKMFQEYGIKVRAYLILGLPGEDHETVQDTRHWLAEAKPNSFGLGIFAPYPGSDIYQNPQNYDIEFSKKVKPEDLLYRTKPGEYQCFVRTSALSSDDILRYREEISKEFNEFGIL